MSKKEPLVITISGAAATGKTAMVTEIANYLRTKGFTDLEIFDIDLDNGFQRSEEMHNKAFESIKSRPVKLTSI